MPRVVISGGRVIDPTSRLNRRMDLLIESGAIVDLVRPGKTGRAFGKSARHIDATRCWVLPGLIDLHVHLRQPGMGRAETVATGTRAAAAGGFTRVVCMPNTRPVLDTPGALRRLMRIIEKDALIDVTPAVALSIGLHGERLTDIQALARAGARVLSDDGLGTRSSSVLARALEQARRLDLVVMVHNEDKRLSAGGVMRAGPSARRLGLPGIPAAAEWKRVQRDLRILGQQGGRLHLQHLSCERSLREVRRAKRAGLPVSCEVTPHHLHLTDRDVLRSADGRGPNPDFKMNPPLASSSDQLALRRGLVDGTVDALATDHAPHTRVAKSRGFAAAPFGVIGLETAFPLTLQLVREEVLDLVQAVALWTCGPARVLGIRAGQLKAGWPADVCLVDPERTWVVDPGRLKSRAANTPFDGWRLRGKIVRTVVAGRTIFRG